MPKTQPSRCSWAKPLWPYDASVPDRCSQKEVVRALQILRFEIVREGNHIAMARENPDGSRTPLTLPNHSTLKASTLQHLLRQSQIPKGEFLAAYRRAR